MSIRVTLMCIYLRWIRGFRLVGRANDSDGEFNMYRIFCVVDQLLTVPLCICYTKLQTDNLIIQIIED